MKLKYYEVTVIQRLPIRIPVIGFDEAEARKAIEDMEDLGDIFDSDSAVYTIEKVKSISRKRCEEWAEEYNFYVLSTQGFADSIEEAEADLLTASELHSDTCKDEENLE